MDSNRNSKDVTLFETLRPFGYEALCNLDTVILVVCSLGLWLSSVPHIVHSLRMIQDTSNKDPFFRQPSSISEYVNGSFDLLLSNHNTQPAMAAFLYAKWDADSKFSRGIIESTNQFSPLELFAIDCWVGSCSKTIKAKRYPELRLYFKDFEDISYQGSLDQLHIAHFFSRALRPIVFIASEAELSTLLLQNKFVVVGKLSDWRVKSVAYDSFYKTAVRLSASGVFKESLEFSGFDVGKDILFAIANLPINNNSAPRKSSSEEMYITLYFNCNDSEVTYDVDLNRVTPHRLSRVIMNAVALAQANSKCYTYPTDITPTSNRRSTALSSIISSNPVLFLVGPHLSLSESASPELYLLNSLRISYSSCNDSSFAVPPDPNRGVWTRSGSFPKGSNAHKLLYRLTSGTQRYRAQLASVCPLWLRDIASHLKTSPVDMCGILDDESVDSTAPDTDASLPVERIPRTRMIYKLQKLLQNSSTHSAVSNLATTLLQRLYSESESTSDRHTQSLDDAAIVEHLQFTCCRWLHLAERIHSHHDSDAHDTDGPSELLSAAAKNGGLPPSSEMDHLACVSNQTLQFHVLDSWLQPTLAWELTGFDELAQSKRLGAAIIDQKAETVYRLEEAVTYESLSKFIVGFHASRLKPWRRHPRPTSAVNTTVDHPNLISIRNADHLNELLESRTHLHPAEWSGPTGVNSSLVLLYYSRACGLSTHGDSLLWHFESVARNFAANPTVMFARVDVSAVELPWHLRVERIPSVIYFPNYRSTYSSVFPLTTDMDDLSFSLTQFIQTQSVERPAVDSMPQTTQKSFSLRAREALLNLLTPPSSKIHSLTIDHIHKHCDAHRAVKVRAMCRGGVRLAINAHKSRLAHAQLAAGVLVQQLQSHLNELNERATSLSHRLYAPLSYRKRLSLSLQAHSELWSMVRSYEDAILTTQRFLSPTVVGRS